MAMNEFELTFLLRLFASFFRTVKKIYFKADSEVLKNIRCTENGVFSNTPKNIYTPLMLFGLSIYQLRIVRR